ncbi:T7SS effector LXG polymorphic toxin [Sporolactobacillus sp. Y61]|uniref:T7SS effector LXG polymorphic toxin n=1 Tax=Sporolactobacillus sp. Y61 TaxID=3160863 RepID=A0AAU8III7_9BACL
MRAARYGGAGSAGSTQVYDAESLKAAAESQADTYQNLRDQFHALRTAFTQLSELGSDFQGQGATAIKNFYSAQVQVVDAWLRLLDKQVAYYRGIAGEIDDRQLGGRTHVQIPFLNEDLMMGYARSKAMIRDQREQISRILRSVSDLVSIPVFSNHDVDQALDEAEKKRAQTVLDVQNLDQSLTSEYHQITEDLPYIASLYGELIHATKQGADVQPMHFNAEAWRSSAIYQAQDEMKQVTGNYLQYKKQQENVREMEKQKEAEANRPWYQKAGSAMATFAGELSGYYDYLRAVEGIDPETGRKLSAGERATAGAMAAATFIPIIGWGGRIAKGGTALYKTTRGTEAVGKALNTYDQANQTLKVLSQSEKGITALLAANGITQATTGRDLFGRQLTEDEQRSSLLQGVFMMNLFTRRLAISPEQKASVHEQSQAFKAHVAKIVHNAKASVSSNKWKPAMAGASDDLAKVSDDAEGIAKTLSATKVDRSGNIGEKSSAGVGRANDDAIHSNLVSTFGEMNDEDAIRYNQYWVDVSKGLDTETRVKLTQWGHYRPSTSLYSEYKHVYDNPKYYNQETGEIYWPKNNGAELGTEERVSMGSGDTFGRIGGEKGRFVAPCGTSPEQLSLAPGTDLSKYTEYRVLQEIPDIEKARVAPWFDQPGGGIQFFMPAKIKDLLQQGYIEKIGK